MTYFDWKYYKELLIGNKELGKVQREFTVVVIKIKNVSAFIAEFFSSQFVYVQKKKRDSDVAWELFWYMQSGQKELQLYSNQMIFPLNKLPHNFWGGGNNFIVAYKKKDGIFLWLCKGVFLFKYFILGLFIDRFYLICQVLLKIYFFFIPDLNTGFGTLTHISKSWQIFPSGEREKKKSFFLPKPYSDFVCMHTKTAS